MANRGTFQFTSYANQDPMFYVHHAFNFAAWDMGLQRLHKSVNEKGGPYFNFEKSTIYEMSGSGFNDVTVFNNLVSYKKGAVVGDRHTWKDILEMWHWDRREFRWDFNTEHAFKNMEGFENSLDNDIYDQELLNSYEKEDADTIECSFMMNVPGVGPQPSDYIVTEECCNVLNITSQAVMTSQVDNDNLMDGLCGAEPSGVRCWQVAETNFDRLLSVDVLTGLDFGVTYEAIKNKCSAININFGNEDGESRSGTSQRYVYGDNLHYLLW